MIPKTNSGRWLAGIAGVVVVITVASIAVTLMTGSRVEALPEGSPERAVQDYLQAIQERQYAAAYNLLAPEVQDRCTQQDFQASIGTPDQSSVRIQLDSVDHTAADTAAVYVRITQTYAGQPFPNESSFIQMYGLQQISGEWKLTQPTWPYSVCSYGPVKPIPMPTPPATPTVTPGSAA